MKRVLLIFGVAMLATATLATAQIRWGAKLGGNLSTLSQRDYEGNKNNEDGTSYPALFGFHVGGVMEYSFSESFALQPELQFMRNGGKIKWTGEDAGTYTIAINQIQLPINAKYMYALNDDMRLFGLAGPYFGFGLSAKATNSWDDDETDLYEVHEGDDKSFMKRFDLGIGAGLGIEYKKFTFGLGYQLGLMNLQNTDSSEDKSSTKFNSFTFGVGYFF